MLKAWRSISVTSAIMASAFLAERQPALVAQEQLAADPLLEPVDPAHQRGAGEPEHVGGVAETLVTRAGQKRFQIIPGRVQDVFRPVLHQRSTPVQYLLHTPYPRPLIVAQRGHEANDRGATWTWKGPLCRTARFRYSADRSRSRGPAGAARPKYLRSPTWRTGMVPGVHIRNGRACSTIFTTIRDAS